jgi:serine phosphatase RsbU (regulator of sigma subunit)
MTRSTGLPPWARRLGHIAWQAPLIALPFALFFAVLFGRGGTFAQAFGTSYQIALVFALSVMLSMWVAFYLTPLRALRESSDNSRGAMIRASVAYTAMSMIGSFIGALLVHQFVLPGFLGGGRQLAIVFSFTILFATMGLAIAWALQFHAASLAKVRADQELTLARRIQESFLVREFPALVNLDVHAVNVSSQEVSGDFYDFVPVGGGHWLLAIADVTGKGVPAALLSSMLQASLRTQAGAEERSPARIVTSMNRLAYRSTLTEQFATFFMACIDATNLTLSYTNAGHNHPYVLRADGRLEMLDAGGVIVGILEDFPYAEGRIALSAGDLFLAYTDGVTEAMDAGGEFYGEERLEAVLAALPAGISARDVIERILEDLRRFLAGVEAGDDVTLVAVRFRN